MIKKIAEKNGKEKENATTRDTKFLLVFINKVSPISFSSCYEQMNFKW
jgi:hypothetical protein